MPEEMARKCDGILRLQFGTNKLANQSGMTGFGTPRSVLLKPKWKSEWIEEYEQARAEWQSQEEKRREEEHGQHATDERRNSDDQDDSDGDEPDDDDDDDVEQIGSTVRIYGPRTTETN
ncbi:calponin family repeat-containing domain protein [Trichinella nativa]|uniref:Calponin family repeat-containing domain protein n=1 Tax=Trichinella nativa TaxID=6335 RepID=A0A1Y3EYB7_9BILA|nr:calponin family repeat-containing domain protein [Trichinella nativa]